MRIDFILRERKYTLENGIITGDRGNILTALKKLVSQVKAEAKPSDGDKDSYIFRTLFEPMGAKITAEKAISISDTAIA